MPSSMSSERVSNLGLINEPQITLGILDKDKLRVPKIFEINIHKSDYRGSPEIEWVIEISPPDNYYFDKEEFLQVFDYDWRSNFSSNFYAHFPDSNEWSFAIYGGSPQVFDSLELAIELTDRYNENDITEERLNNYLTELHKRLQKFGVEFIVNPNVSITEAVEKSKTLRAFQRKLYNDVTLVLQSKTKFEPIRMWNTLVNVGLKWGDGDIFHWENYGSESGDEQIFSVWTTTDPGYFFPEEIKNKRMKPKNLVFGFQLPRSVDPERVFEMMFNAVEYCQQELGGQILDENGNPFDKERYEKRIKESLTSIEEKGLRSGEGYLLRIF